MIQMRTTPESNERYTPNYAVLPIIKYLPPRAVVWCPFDTDNSEFVLALKEYGFKVVYSHIIMGQDFFKYEPERWDIIVSNPPFGSKKKIFERCLSFGKPFALLMSNMWLNDTAPCRLFKDNELQLLLFDKRVQYNGLGAHPFRLKLLLPQDTAEADYLREFAGGKRRNEPYVPRYATADENLTGYG